MTTPKPHIFARPKPKTTEQIAWELGLSKSTVKRRRRQGIVYREVAQALGKTIPEAKR